MNKELPLKSSIELTYQELCIISGLIKNVAPHSEKARLLEAKIIDILMDMEELYYGSSDAVSSDEPPLCELFDDLPDEPSPKLIEFVGKLPTNKQEDLLIL